MLHPDAAIVDAPVVIGDTVALRRAVRTPAGEDVAFLGSIELAPLLGDLRAPITAARLVRSWRLAPPDAAGVVRWLMANAILTSVP